LKGGLVWNVKPPMKREPRGYAGFHWQEVFEGSLRTSAPVHFLRHPVG